jgi:hypothetical protein
MGLFSPSFVEGPARRHDKVPCADLKVGYRSVLVAGSGDDLIDLF